MKKYAIIHSDGTSYYRFAASPEEALKATEKSEGGTEVEDHLDIEMPRAGQWDGTGADWLAEKAIAAGLIVVRG